MNKNMGNIVCKFGGTSMADEKSMEQVAKIVKANPARRYIVSICSRKNKGLPKGDRCLN